MEPRDINWREAADEHERQEANGYAFAMPFTFPTHPARVRRIPLADLASITGLSSEMQATVLEVFREVQTGGTFAVRKWQDLESNQARQKQLANGLCVAGFIEPRLVETQAEADATDDPAVLWVGRIDIRDRLAYMQTVMNPESEAAKALAPFPENGARDSEPGQTVPLTTATISTNGTNSLGIQPADVPAV